MKISAYKRSGQASVEYVILLFFAVTVLFMADLDDLLIEAIDSYYQDMASLMNLPIP